MLSQLRKAGGIVKGAALNQFEGLRKFDEQYSDKIAEMYSDKGPVAQTLGYTVGGAHPSFVKGEPDEEVTGALRGLMEYGLPAVNAVPKYVLPAAGVTLAGKALIDTANAIQGAQQTEATLGLDAGEMTASALVGGGLAAGPGIVEMIRTPKGIKGPGRGTVAATAAAGAGAMAGVNAALQMLGYGS